MAESKKGSGTFIPAVDSDRLWKDHIRRIMMNQLYIWPDKWSFLVEEYKKMHEALEGKRPLSPYDCSKAFAASALKSKAKTYLPPIQQNLQAKLPRTTSGMYGHMHLKDGHNLVYERQLWTMPGHRQHDLIKLFKWPMDYYD